MDILYKLFRPARTVFCLITCLFLLFSTHADAQTSLFTVENLRVDITADNALHARDQAFEKAQRDAFHVLAQRMVDDGQIPSFTIPDTTVIATMVKDYELTNEKISTVRYVGTYTFRFREQAVRQYFSMNNLPYTDVQSRPVLILPFYDHNGTTTIWSANNPWMTAWHRTGRLDGLVPVVVPIGDIEDVRDIGDRDALTYNGYNLMRMLERYNASDAVIAIASQESGSEAGKLNIDLYKTDRQKPEFIQRISVSGGYGAATDALFAAAVGKVQTALQRDWKSRTIPRQDPYFADKGLGSYANEFQIRVPFRNLREWADTQRSLKKVSGVDGLKIKSLSRGSAMVGLLYRGSEEQLRLALQQANMSLIVPTSRYERSRSGPPVYELRLDRYSAPAYMRNY